MKLAVTVVVYQPEIPKIVRASVFLGNHVVHVKAFSLVNRGVPARLRVSHTVGAPSLAVRPRALPAD